MVVDATCCKFLTLRNTRLRQERGQDTRTEQLLLGIILTVIGCFILWWRARSLSYPIILRPTIFRNVSVPVMTMILGLSFTAFGLYMTFKKNPFVALGISVLLGVHQVLRLSRNRIKSRIDRVFRCYNEIRLANIVRQNLNQPLFDDTEMIRKTAALYAKRQSWPGLKIDSFRLSFIDTEGGARVENLKDLAHALLLFEAREERMDEWSDKHFALNGEAWNYLNDRYERSKGA